MKQATSFPAILFCPADRPDRYQKALDRADSVILDLEDSVLIPEKDRAREALGESTLPKSRVIVRVNSVQSGLFQADLAAVAKTPYRTIMVAKAEDADLIETIPSSYRVIAMCETAKGVREACRIAQLPNVIGLMWGAEDLIASLGGTSSRFGDGGYRDVARFARSQVLVAARSAGKFAIDAVHLDINDLEGLAAEAEDASASGFQATACIHPSQVETVRRAYQPSAEAVAWAERVLDAAADQPGVFTFEGQMVDEPILRHARSVLNRVRRA